MRDLSPWLPDLVPPPGGLVRLRHSVQSVRPARRWQPAGIAVCGMLLLALVIAPGVLQRYRVRADLTDALRQAIQPVEPGQLRIADGAALALDSGHSGVRLYLVQSAPSAATASRR